MLAHKPMTETPIAAGRVSVSEIAAAVRGLLPNTHRALLFGSRASGRASTRSDWDIDVVGQVPLDGAVRERIRAALDELPTLRSFDVVDLSTAPETLRDRALREGVSLA